MIVVGILVCLCASAVTQRVESVQNPNAENGCNVVNVHFGGNGDEDEGGMLRGDPGPPGKRGILGPPGVKGNQGEKGSKGEKGEMTDLGFLKKEITSLLSARSCSELKEQHGISTSGYYFIRSPYLESSPVYRYCNFRVYQDVFTCHQLFQLNNTLETGFYTIGSRGQSFEVFCSISNGRVITEVWHDSMDEIRATDCEPQHCYSRSPVYRIPMDKIISIITHSQNCKQFIKFRCHGSMLFRDNQAYWVSRGGDIMKYWGDVPSQTSGNCACGETGTCIDNSYKCNCDQNSGRIMTQDEGYLTDKSKLPVKEMKFGDMGGSGEHGWHTLGKLECSG